jgi:hypothetical protein
MLRPLSKYKPMNVPPLKIAEQHGITYAEIEKVVKNSVRAIQKAYSFTGCLTAEDLYNTGWVGALTALTKEKFAKVKNKLAYIYVFSKGYQQHAVHRKSRMIKPSYEDLRACKPYTAHLSYSWDNLPEASYIEPDSKPEYELVNLLSEKDKAKLLKGLTLSLEGQAIVNQIKLEYGNNQ